MKRCINPMIGVLLMLVLAGCRKELCYNHDEHAMTVKLHAIAEWEQEWERMYEIDWKNIWKQEWNPSYDDLRPEPADGIRAIVYCDDGDYDNANLQSNGGRLPVHEGKHSVLLYNNDTEYIVFDDLSISALATATTRTVSRASLPVMHSDEPTVNQPDQLYGCYIEEYIGEKTLEPIELNVMMRPLTYTYYIRYNFSNGLKYVALARGALAGMSEDVYLYDGHTDSETATILFDCELKDFGAEAKVRSFGVPNYPGDHYTRADGTPAYYTLNLEVMLNNGKLKEFMFDVTDQINAQPRGGVITVRDIAISDEEGLEGSGGFQPDINDWGEWQDIPLM